MGIKVRMRKFGRPQAGPHSQHGTHVGHTLHTAHDTINIIMETGEGFSDSQPGSAGPGSEGSQG